jgi:asparagine synthase (glutamine-hydrolysing)
MIHDSDSLATPTIESMMDALRHRGPDSSGLFVHDRGGIGVRRLRIIDLATGDQPVHNEDGSCHIVFNGEIYNYRELRSALMSNGHSFYTNSDTEVIVHLYEDLGESCLSSLDGMFAFCIWDLKKESFFLARDPIGEKPLYYVATDQEFIFASEPKSILRYPSYVAKVDLDSLKEYLVYGYVPSPRAMFQGMKKLEPGNSLFVKAGGELTVRNYYRGAWKKPPKGSTRIKERAAKEIENAVKSRLVSDVPIGVLLSGGMDSSLVAFFASKAVGPQAIQAFTIGFQDKNYDESEYATKVASLLGLPHDLTILNERDVIDHVQEALALLDEPIGDPSFVPTYMVSRIASQTVRVVLTGDGGDEVFGGYPKYRVHKLLGKFDRLPIAMKVPLSRFLRGLPEKLVGPKVKRILMTLDLDPAERNLLWIGPFLPDEARRLYPLFGSFRFHELEQKDSPNYYDPVEAALEGDIRYSLGDLFLSKVDRASMACSLETRTPFLAPKLVEFARGLPSTEKVNLTHTKILLKKVALDYLPQENVIRRKQGFGMPVASWIRGPMRRPIELALSDEKLKQHGLFSIPYVKSLLEDHFSSKRDNSVKIWCLFVFQVWFEKWIWNHT